MAVAKRPGRETSAKIEQRKVRISGKTKSTPGWPNLHRTGPGREKHKKRSQSSLVLFSSRLWVDMPSHLEDGFSCYFLNKIEL